MIEKAKSLINKIDGYKTTTFGNNNFIKSNNINNNSTNINKYEDIEEIDYSDDSFNELRQEIFMIKNNNSQKEEIENKARRSKLDLQEEKMQEDYNKRHGDNINNSAAQFNLGYSSSLGFQSSITTENIDEQIETLGNNIKLYEEYINLLGSEVTTLNDFIAGVDWFNLGNVFPRMLYDSSVLDICKFSDILYVLQYLGCETENVDENTYKKNIEEKKYLPYMSEYIDGTSLEEHVNFNIFNALQILGPDAGFLQDFKNNSIRFGKELSSEYLQQNYIYQPGYFTDYYHNTFFYQNSFEIFGQIQSDDAKKYTYYAYGLGKTVEDLKKDLALYLGCSEDEVYAVLSTKESKDMKKYLNSLESDFYKKLLNDKGYNFDELSEYFVEHYKESLMNNVNSDTYKDEFISELLKKLNLDESVLINSTDFENYKNSVGEFYLNFIAGELFSKKYNETLKNKLDDELMSLNSDLQSIKKMHEILKLQKLDLELNKLIDPSDFEKLSSQVPLELTAISESSNLSGVSTSVNSIDFVENLFLMTETERKKFYYLWNKEGKNTALEYYSVIEEELNSRNGLIDAYNWLATNFVDDVEVINSIYDLSNDKIELMKEKIANKYDESWDFTQFMQDINLIGKDLVDSVQSSAEGLINLLCADGVTSANDYEKMYFNMFLSENENIATAHSITTSVGNMALPMLISTLNPILGASWMGASSAGNTREAALQEGYNQKQAMLYGLFTGLSEAVMEKFFGGIPGISILDDIPGVKGMLVRTVMEAPEEQSQMFIDMFLRQQILGEQVNIDWKEFEKTGVYSMITAGLLNNGKLVFEGLEIDLNQISPEVIEKAINTNNIDILIEAGQNQKVTHDNINEVSEIDNLILSKGYDLNNPFIKYLKSLPVFDENLLTGLDDYKNAINSKVTYEIAPSLIYDRLMSYPYYLKVFGENNAKIIETALSLDIERTKYLSNYFNNFSDITESDLYKQVRSDKNFNLIKFIDRIRMIDKFGMENIEFIDMLFSLDNIDKYSDQIINAKNISVDDLSTGAKSYYESQNIKEISILDYIKKASITNKSHLDKLYNAGLDINAYVADRINYILSDDQIIPSKLYDTVFGTSIFKRKEFNDTFETGLSTFLNFKENGIKIFNKKIDNYLTAILEFENLFSDNISKDKIREFFKKDIIDFNSFLSISIDEVTIEYNKQLNNLLTKHNDIINNENVKISNEYFQADDGYSGDISIYTMDHTKVELNLLIHSIPLKQSQKNMTKMSMLYYLSEALPSNPNLWDNARGTNYISMSLVKSNNLHPFGTPPIMLGFNNVTEKQIIMSANADLRTKMEVGYIPEYTGHYTNPLNCLNEKQIQHNEFVSIREGVKPDYIIAATAENKFGIPVLNDDMKKWAVYFDIPIYLFDNVPPY